MKAKMFEMKKAETVNLTKMKRGHVLYVPADTESYVVEKGEMNGPYQPGNYNHKGKAETKNTKFRIVKRDEREGIAFNINKVCEYSYRKGTGELVFLENRYGLTMHAKAAYTVRYRITNPEVFLRKLVGLHATQYDNEDVERTIDTMILPKLKAVIISGISKGVLHEMQNDLASLGKAVMEALHSTLSSYGITLVEIAVTAVNIDQNDMKRINNLEESVAREKITPKREPQENPATRYIPFRQENWESYQTIKVCEECRKVLLVHDNYCKYCGSKQ